VRALAAAEPDRYFYANQYNNPANWQAHYNGTGIEIWEQTWFFFQPPTEYDPGVIKKRWKEQTPGQMNELTETLRNCEPFTAESVEREVKELISAQEWGMGAIMNAWRLLLVGAAKGPGLFDLAAFLGKEEVVRRMESGIRNINP
jgi:glutamyl-tRNA synthetase